MSKKDLPIIFVLDMDKCIVGNTDYLSLYSQLVDDFIFLNCKHKKLSQEICSKIDKDIWKKDIPPYFFRPYLKEFIEEIRKIFPTSEFFIFSSGTRMYVNEFIPLVEEFIDFKFNRPLLTRDDTTTSVSNYIVKEIKGFMEQFLKTIKSKYPKVDLISSQDFIYDNRLIIIDDIPEFWLDNPKLVKCSPYEYSPIPIIDSQVLKLIKDNKEVITYINKSKNNLLPPNFKQASPDYIYEDFLMDYHIFQSQLLRSNYYKNKEAMKDEFFKNLLTSLKPRAKLAKPFTPEFIKTLNKN